jgi:O-methyltransferase involved in polyketide biosynthesis
VFEVDHPATQARKRQLLGDAATFVAWEFEPELLPSWLAARRFALEHNDTTGMLAARWLPADLAAKLKEDQRRKALARRRASGLCNLPPLR